jgi:hypothetical protein
MPPQPFEHRRDGRLVFHVAAFKLGNRPVGARGFRDPNAIVDLGCCFLVLLRLSIESAPNGSGISASSGYSRCNRRFSASSSAKKPYQPECGNRRRDRLACRVRQSGRGWDRGLARGHAGQREGVGIDDPFHCRPREFQGGNERLGGNARCKQLPASGIPPHIAHFAANGFGV